MTHSLRTLSLPIVALLLAVSAAPNAAFAADAMAANAMAGDAMATDAMAGDAMAGDAMGMMSDADLALCLEQAAAITFPDVMHAATEACHGVHNGAMGGDAMGGDAMSGDAMATDAMAPAK